MKLQNKINVIGMTSHSSNIIENSCLVETNIEEILHPSLMISSSSPITKFNELYCYPPIKMMLIIMKQLSLLQGYIEAKRSQNGFIPQQKEEKIILSLKHEEIHPRIYPIVKSAKHEDNEAEDLHSFKGPSDRIKELGSLFEK